MGYMLGDEMLTTLDHRLDALLARLVRTLPGADEALALREALSRLGHDDPVLHSVSRCVAALREQKARLSRVAEVQGGESTPARHATEPLPAFDFHERPTMAISALGNAAQVEAATRPVEVPAAPKVNWGPCEQLLYEDIVTLFELGDQAGAMVSVERLLMLSPKAHELDIFLERNEATLKKLYEDYFGSFDRILVPLRNAHPIKIPTPDAAAVMDVLRLVDGQRTLREVIRLSRLGEVRGLVSLAHLARSGFIEMA